MLRTSILPVLLLISPSVYACNLTAQDLAENLSLDFIKFDQTQHQGHRKFAENGCFLEAAELTDIYHLQHQNELKKWQDRISYFHAGQYYAMVGVDMYGIASQRIGSAYDPAESKDSDITWNIYVDATVAFLKRDLELLKKKRMDMDVKDTIMQKINIKVVDGLIRCFDKPYVEAYKSPFCRGE